MKSIFLEKRSGKIPNSKSLWDDHLLYEKQIEKLESKSFRTHRNNNPSSCSKAEAGGQNQKLMDILDRLKEEQGK